MRTCVIEQTRSMPWRRKQATERSPLKILLWAAVAGLVATLIVLSGPIEDSLRVARNNFHRHAASRDIVLVTIDNQSLRDVGRWPWPRRYHARMIDRLTAAGAKRIFFDVTFETRSDSVDDQLLADAIERSGRVTLPVRGDAIAEGIAQENPRPLELFSRHAQLASIAILYNNQNAVWHLPYSVDLSGQRLPSLAAALAERKTRAGQFGVDYSIDTKTIPTINSERVIDGHFDPRLVAGRDVIVGTNSD